MKAYTTQKNEGFFIVWNNENDRSIMIHEDALWEEFKGEFYKDREWHKENSSPQFLGMSVVVTNLDSFDEWLTEKDKIAEYINIFNN